MKKREEKNSERSIANIDLDNTAHINVFIILLYRRL